MQINSLADVDQKGKVGREFACQDNRRELVNNP